MYSLLRYLPKNHLSFAAGKLAGIPLPKFMRSPLYRLYSRFFEARLEEIEQNLEDYVSLASFFVRSLRPGCRPLGQGLLSPVDGSVGELGTIREGRLFQVKGREYSLSDLLRDEKLAAEFESGHFITLYLAPGDYHHIHSPVDGAVTNSIHIEGRLWPVNAWSIGNIDGVFSQNERVVSCIESEDFGTVVLVMVGATNVGSIRLEYDAIRTNSLSRLFSRRRGVFRKNYEPAIKVARGERLGTFYLGSTVVLCIKAQAVDFPEGLKGRKIKFGESLTSLNPHGIGRESNAS